MRSSPEVVLLVLLIIIGGGCGLLGDDDEQSALDVVEAAYDAYNTGDSEQWIQLRVRGSEFQSDDFRERVMDDMRKETGEETASGAVYEDIVCESHGSGERPVADAGSVSGYYITCDTTLALPDGDTSEAFEWVVHEGEVIAVRSTE